MDKPQERTVDIRLAAGFQEAVVDIRQEAYQAIGYLANWAIGSERYVKARICGDANGEFDGTYFDKDGNITYVMGAVLTDGKYSFHS